MQKKKPPIFFTIIDTDKFAAAKFTRHKGDFKLKNNLHRTDPPGVILFVIRSRFNLTLYKRINAFRASGKLSLVNANEKKFFFFLCNLSTSSISSQICSTN